MIELCGISLSEPSNKIILKSRIAKGEFPSELEKPNLVPDHKKNAKQFFKKCRPISHFSGYLAKGLKE